MNNNIENDFLEIAAYAHWINWGPDWNVVRDVYSKFPNAYSVLTPFAYTYLEEMIRSRTSEYGREIIDNSGLPKRRSVGRRLIKLAKHENSDDRNYLEALKKIEKYYNDSNGVDAGDNRSSVAHGYMHPRFWSKESFEQLIHDIADFSKFARF